MRDWNAAPGGIHVGGSFNLKPTYEGLKLSSPFHVMQVILYLKPTYEGLKHNSKLSGFTPVPHLTPTYEGLKLNVPIRRSHIIG